MAVNRAYIAGLGTTGLLVGFAMLTLAVVGAILAFRGWPGEGIVDGSGPVGIESGGLLEIDRLRLSGGAGDAGGGAGLSARAERAVREARGDLIGVGGASAGEAARPAPSPNRDGAGGAAQTAPAPAAAAPGGEGGLAEGVESTTHGAVEAVGQVGVPSTHGVTEAGGGLSEAVRGAGGALER